MPFGQALGGMLGLGAPQQRGQMNFGGQMRGFNPQQMGQIGGFGQQLGQRLGNQYSSVPQGRMPGLGQSWNQMNPGMQQNLFPGGKSPEQMDFQNQIPMGGGIGPRFDKQGFMNSMGGQDAMRNQIGQAIRGGLGGMRGWFENMRQQMANYQPQQPQQPEIQGY